MLGRAGPKLDLDRAFFRLLTNKGRSVYKEVQAQRRRSLFAPFRPQPLLSASTSAAVPAPPNPRAMGKKEATGSRAEEADERPQKAPRLDSMDFGCGLAAIQRVGSSIEDEGSKPCSHLLALEDRVDSLVAKIKSRNKTPVCEHCWLQSFGGTAFGSRKHQRYEPSALKMVCLECMRCFCVGSGGATTGSDPLGHAWSHAHEKGHWVALWFDQPHKAYCFMCERALCSNQPDRVIEVLESAVDDAHASRPDTDQLCRDVRGTDASGAHASRPDNCQPCRVIRGIPNPGNKCYVNALVQCLLALDKLRTWMLGPKAPRGSLGGALKELFEQTTPGNDAGATLNPNKLLESLGALHPQYAGTTMEDSQELLLDIYKSLNEEKLLWPPKMRDRYPTVDSIFLGQTFSTVTCKWCPYCSSSDEPFSELSLPLPSKGQTVDSPQRSLAIEESNLKKVQTDAVDKDTASEPLNTECTKAEQVWQREDDLLGILQTEDDNISCSELLRDVIEMPQKSAYAGYLQSQQEFLVEHKEKVQVTPEDKGKYLSRNFVYGDEEDSNSLASVEHCLADYFKDVEVEWTCDNCKKVSTEAGAGSPVKGSASSSTTNEEFDRDGKAEKRIDISITQDSQSASTTPDSGKQIDRKGKHGNKAVVISKLPPVLSIHLMRFNNNQVKMAGHVSFGEILDVGPFMDPRSEGKDNSSYRLSGVIEHIGDKLSGGHYVAYMRASTIESGSSSWFYASDEYISPVTLEQVLKCEAYILFYERMED